MSSPTHVCTAQNLLVWSSPENWAASTISTCVVMTNVLAHPMCFYHWCPQGRWWWNAQGHTYRGYRSYLRSVAQFFLNSFERKLCPCLRWKREVKFINDSWWRGAAKPLKHSVAETTQCKCSCMSLTSVAVCCCTCVYSDAIRGVFWKQKACVQEYKFAPPPLANKKMWCTQHSAANSGCVSNCTEY